MRASDIQEQITINEMFDILVNLGAEPILNNENEIIAKSICHGDSRYKLYYYDNSKRFTCYTNCGSGFSIFDLLQKVLDISFIESLNMIKNKLDIKGSDIPICQMPDFDCFKKFEGRDASVGYKDFDINYLKYFHKLYHESWIDDGISIQAMKKFDIRFNIPGNQIIIPHFDINNKLIGIRVRNLNKDVVDSGYKYMPLYHGGEDFSHNIRGNLYGLNVSENTIKEKGIVIIFESEKACMQYETMFPNENIAVALCGSNLTEEQSDIINNLDVSEVVIALDKEFDEVDDSDAKEYAMRIRANFLSKLLLFHKVSIIWDKDNLLRKKDSPSDRGKDVFLELFNNRLIISE